jgi:hypothetical protein
MARKHEQRAKQGAVAQKRVAKLEEAAVNDRERAERAELNTLRYQVAAEKGLPVALATRLQGDTMQELEADADQLLDQLLDALTREPEATAANEPRSSGRR